MLASETGLGALRRRGQSQKPAEIYELIEKLVPNGAPQGDALCPCALFCFTPSCARRGFLGASAENALSDARILLRCRRQVPGDFRAEEQPEGLLGVRGERGHGCAGGQRTREGRRPASVRAAGVRRGRCGSDDVASPLPSPAAGTGLPPSDIAALKEDGAVPNAKFGRAADRATAAA